jgi:phage terminase large subunit-like protein
LKKGKSANDADWRSKRNIAWIETHLRIPEGKLVGRPFRLVEFQKKFIRDVYDNPHGTRLAILCMARKNAKTTLIAALVLLHTVGPEAKPNAQLVSAAQTRDQASLVFSLASKMVRMSPTISGFVTPKDSAKQIVCRDLGTVYKALSADAASNYGLSPAVSVHDELGQVKGPRSELYDAIETATAAQESPISFVISTQAPTDGDLLSILIDDALVAHDKRTIIHLYTTPDGVDLYSEDAIKAANPAYDHFMNKEEVLRMASEAKRLPSKQSSFENLVLNRRVEVNSPFVSRSIWDACGGNAENDFEELEVYAGLDLSSTNDLTALVRTANIGGIWHVLPTFWLPKMGLREKSDADRVPYTDWEERGFLETTPGASIQYEWVAHRIFADHKMTPFKRISFDRWNYKHLKPWLLKAGFTEVEVEGDDAIFKEFGQGFQSMSPALLTLEGLLLEKKILHPNHPVLTMCAANATVKSDPSGNRKLDKSNRHSRIDGMVALAMAVAVGAEEFHVLAGPSIYETRGALTL